MADCRPRVLVVDDDPTVRGMLCDLLAFWGCETDAAGDGQEGLEFFGRNRYDLVVTDHLMPRVTGGELVKAVRRQDPDVGIIMLTASADVDAHPQRSGFTLLHKPVDVGGLERVVRGALDQAGR